MKGLKKSKSVQMITGLSKNGLNHKDLYEQAVQILEQRAGVYGSFETSLTHITNYWNVYLEDKGFLNKALNPSDTSTLLTLFKIARTLEGFDSMDTFIDAANYFTQAYFTRNARSSKSLKDLVKENTVEKSRQTVQEKLLNRIIQHYNLDGSPKQIENVLQQLFAKLEFSGVKKETEKSVEEKLSTKGVTE